MRDLMKLDKNLLKKFNNFYIDATNRVPRGYFRIIIKGLFVFIIGLKSALQKLFQLGGRSEA